MKTIRIHIPLHTFCFIFLFILTTCQPRNKQPSGTTARDWPQIIKDGELKVLIDLSPTGYFIKQGQPTGFEFELISAFCKDHNLFLNTIIIENFDHIFLYLDSGLVDLAAANLTITPQRKKKALFTTPVTITQILLIKNKNTPDSSLKVYLRKNSSYSRNIQSINHSLPLTFEFVSGNIDDYDILDSVNTGNFQATLIDENTFNIFKHKFPNIQIVTNLGIPQKIAWAVSIRSKKLHQKLNHWLKKFKKTRQYQRLIQKYFRHSQSSYVNQFIALKKKRRINITPFDETFKGAAKRTGVDWLLLAAIAYNESRFNDSAVSHKNASGIMQLMPQTAAQFNIDSSSSRYEHILAGAKLYKIFYSRWLKITSDSSFAVKLALASYNAGMGHILDAYRLAVHLNNNRPDWYDIQYYLLHKNRPEYYKSEWVKHGRCFCKEPVNFVHNVLNIYHLYKSIDNYMQNKQNV